MLVDIRLEGGVLEFLSDSLVVHLLLLGEDVLVPILRLLYELLLCSAKPPGLHNFRLETVFVLEGHVSLPLLQLLLPSLLLPLHDLLRTQMDRLDLRATEQRLGVP